MSLFFIFFFFFILSFSLPSFGHFRCSLHGREATALSREKPLPALSRFVPPFILAHALEQHDCVTRQWSWRGRVRDKAPIHLFIIAAAAERMSPPCLPRRPVVVRRPCLTARLWAPPFAPRLRLFAISIEMLVEFDACSNPLAMREREGEGERERECLGGRESIGAEERAKCDWSFSRQLPVEPVF